MRIGGRKSGCYPVGQRRRESGATSREQADDGENSPFILSVEQVLSLDTTSPSCARRATKLFPAIFILTLLVAVILFMVGIAQEDLICFLISLVVLILAALEWTLYGFHDNRNAEQHPPDAPNGEERALQSRVVGDHDEEHFESVERETVV